MILAVDASIQGVSFCIADPTRPAGSRVVWHGSHTENMGAVAAIARLGAAAMAAAKVAPEQLQGLAVSVGPGSFTGIKVGLAFAYGFGGAARRLPMIGLSAFAAAARRVAEDGFGGTTMLFLPATRTHGYCLAGGGAAAPQLFEVTPASVASLCRLPQDSRFLIAGRWPLLTDLLRKSARSTLELATAEVCEAAIYAMAEEACALWPSQFSPELPAPRYLRLSTAEERLMVPAQPPGGPSS